MSIRKYVVAATASFVLTVPLFVPVRAETKTVNIGACIGAQGTSIVNSVIWDHGNTNAGDPDCLKWLWGTAYSSSNEYLCDVGWGIADEDDKNCVYFDDILSMWHLHEVCDDITGLCYGEFGTSDS